MREVNLHISRKSANPFIIKVNSGVDSQYTIPTSGTGFDYEVLVLPSGQYFSNQTGDLTITFPSANTDYFIQIRGLFPRYYQNNNSEKLKVLDRVQFGDVVFSSLSRAFDGMENALCTASDLEIRTTGLTDTSYAFRNNKVMVSHPPIDMSSVTDARSMYDNCSLFGATAFNPDLSNLVNGSNMFMNSGLNPPIFTPDLRSLVNGWNMFYGTPLSGVLNLDLQSATDVWSMFQDTQLEELHIQNMGNINLVNANTFKIPTLKKLTCDDIKESFSIADCPLLLGEEIDNLAMSVRNLTGQSSKVLTLTEDQYSSADSVFWFYSNWTFNVV